MPDQNNTPSDKPIEPKPAESTQPHESRVPEPLTRPELLAAIDAEIERLEEDTKRPGWSMWALQGAIATTLWLALNDLGPKSNLRTVGIVFLFGSVVSDFVLALCDTLGRFGRVERKQPRYRFSNADPLLGPRVITFAFLRALVILLIYFWLGSTLKLPSLAWYYGVLLVMCLIGVPLLLIRRLTLEDPRSLRVAGIIASLQAVWAGYLSFALFEKLPLSVTEYNGSDFRVGFLLTTAAYLAWLIASEQQPRPVVTSMKDIRRELALGRMGVEDAARDVDHALHGLTTSAAAEHKLTNATERLRQAGFEFGNLLANLTSPKSSIQLQ